MVKNRSEKLGQCLEARIDKSHQSKMFSCGKYPLWGEKSGISPGGQLCCILHPEGRFMAFRMINKYLTIHSYLCKLCKWVLSVFLALFPDFLCE